MGRMRAGWFLCVGLLALGCAAPSRGGDEGPSCTDGAMNGDETDVDCGGSCPACANGRRCQAPGSCASGNCVGGTCQAPSGCRPEADGAFCGRLEKNCGDVTNLDNCGGARTAGCGSCQAPQTCGGGNVCGGGQCTTCAQLSASCGRLSDGCGGMLDCGCPSGQTCGAAHVCGSGQCQPESDRQFCSRLGKSCGSVTDFDNCDHARQVATCGSCSGGGVCGGVAANECCQPETEQQTCSRAGTQCGKSSPVKGNCGQAVTCSCYEIRTGTVYQASAGLEWQRAVDPSTYTLDSATSYCRGLPLSNGGWRLPAKDELMGIVDRSRSHPAIDVGAFPNTPSEHFLSSSPYAGFAGYAWVVNFDDGNTWDSGAILYGRVRCVR